MKSATENLLKYYPNVQTFQDLYLHGDLPAPDMLDFNDVLTPIPLYELDSAPVVNEVIILQKNCAQFSRIIKVLMKDPMHIHPDNFEFAKKNLEKIAADCSRGYQLLRLNLNTVEQERHS